jgi:hypothetical protein
VGFENMKHFHNFQENPTPAGGGKFRGFLMEILSKNGCEIAKKSAISRIMLEVLIIFLVTLIMNFYIPDSASAPRIIRTCRHFGQPKPSLKEQLTAILKGLD